MSSPENSPDFMSPGNWKHPSDFAGQKLFDKGADWHNNAMLGWTPVSLDIYAAGYKDAADALIYALTQRRASLDTVVYPLVFLYRQGIELQLKLILPTARRLAKKPPRNDDKHFLMPMWTELRSLLDQLDPYQDDRDVVAVEEFIKQLAEVDPNSFAFRYPTSLAGKVSLPDLGDVNVRHLSEIMDSIFLHINGIHSWLGNQEMQAEHAEY